MKTMNISIPENQAQKIERIMSKRLFASRSEFFRAAIRVFFSLDSAQEDSLDIYKRRPIKVVRKELLKAGYNEKFVNSVVDGIKKSSIYSAKENED